MCSIKFRAKSSNDQKVEKYQSLQPPRVCILHTYAHFGKSQGKQSFIALQASGNCGRINNKRNINNEYLSNTRVRDDKVFLFLFFFGYFASLSLFTHQTKPTKKKEEEKYGEKDT